MPLIRINRHPSARSLRVFAVAMDVVCFGWSWWCWRKGWSPICFSLLALATLTTLLAVVKPRALRGIYLGLSYLTFPIGWVTSHVILAVVYFGIFTPIGLVLRMSGHDALMRRFERDAVSYWQPRAKRAPDAGSYFRQH